MNTYQWMIRRYKDRDECINKIQRLQKEEALCKSQIDILQQQQIIENNKLIELEKLLEEARDNYEKDKQKKEIDNHPLIYQSVYKNNPTKIFKELT